MIRRPPRSTQSRSSAASDVYKRQVIRSALERRSGSALPEAGGGSTSTALPERGHDRQRIGTRHRGLQSGPRGDERGGRGIRTESATVEFLALTRRSECRSARLGGGNYPGRIPGETTPPAPTDCFL